jgi:PleD family two-component response regulator
MLWWRRDEMKVLVVDDDPLSRLVVQTAVERLGHEPTAAEDGEAAWLCFNHDKPDVLITDLMMPGVDGLELCRRVRADVRAGYTYIILATALGEREDVVRGMEAGADDYLVKPVGPFDLQARLIAAQRVTLLHAELARHRADLAHLARHDPLTQLGNRRSLDEDLEVLHARSQRYGRSYCLAICDVDRFKAYNDLYGASGWRRGAACGGRDDGPGGSSGRRRVPLWRGGVCPGAARADPRDWADRRRPRSGGGAAVGHPACRR